jgi:hypothetical protein
MKLKLEFQKLQEENAKLKEELDTIKSLFHLQEKVRSMLLNVQ